MALTSEREAMIWKTLNDTRGKIEPSEYKNYIFGVMFYKFLSEKAQAWLKGVLRGDLGGCLATGFRQGLRVHAANTWLRDSTRGHVFRLGGGYQRR